MGKEIDFHTVGTSSCPFVKCPICGKGDWCCTYEEEYKGKIYHYLICNRYIGSSSVDSFFFVRRTKENGAKFIINDNVSQSSYTYVKPTIKRQYSRMPDKKLHILNTRLLDILKLEDYHRKDLNKDGITDSMIEAFKIRSYPPFDRDRKMNGLVSINPTRSQLARQLFDFNNGDLTGFPGAFINSYGDSSYWTLSGFEGIVFGVTNIYGERVMLQVRLDKPQIDPDTGKPKGKYKAFSSESKIGKDGKEKMPNGIGPGSRAGFIKPPTLKDSYVCYITEGWKKALIGSYNLGSLFLTVQGVNAFSDLFEINDRGERIIDVLRDVYGVGMFIIVYDNDKYHNPNVQFAEGVLAKCLADEGFKVATASWDSYCGKGIDDMFNNRYGSQYMHFELIHG